MWQSYNSFGDRDYNREVADFAATVTAYTEDAEHYIDNCKNDHREIRENGLSLLSLNNRFQRTMSAAFSPIMMHAAFGFPFTIVGMIDASATRSPSTP